MLPSLPTPALGLIWEYLDGEDSRKSLLKASKATRQAFGGVISRCTFIISSSERESRANAVMRRLPAFSLQCLKLKPLNQKSKAKKKPGQAGTEMDRSFDVSLAAFFESGASQRGKPPWSGIKFLRLEGFELSMHSTPFIGLAAPQLSHVHLSHTKLDGMCISGLLSCPSLSHLTFSHVAWLTPKMSERALMVIPLLRHLRHLTFIEVPLPFIDVHNPFPFLHIPRLESLHIIACPLPDIIRWMDLLPSIGHACTNLTSLVIHPRLEPSSASLLLTLWVHDVPIAGLASGCPYLRYLDFGPFATVSDTGVGAMISKMPKLQCVVAQDLRPPPHRNRQEAAAIAGEWVVAVEERRKRQQHRNKRKREGWASGQGHAGAGDQASSTVGQGSHAEANPAMSSSSAAAAAVAESTWEAQVKAAEAAIQAHLYPVHDLRPQGTALPSAEPPATLPWAQLTLFAPSVESIAALPLSPHTKVCLGGVFVRPGTQPALAAQAASQLARCGSFYSTVSTHQETAEAIQSRKNSDMDISIGNKLGKLILIFLPSWSTLVEAPPNTLSDAEDPYVPATSAGAGAASVEAALGLTNWTDANPVSLGRPGGGMGPVGADAMEKVKNAISTLTEDLLATPDSSINAGCARALLELSRLRQRLIGMLQKAAVVECVYASTLACVAAADTTEVTSTTIPETLGLGSAAEQPKSLKDALNAVHPAVRGLRQRRPLAVADSLCSYFEPWRMCFCTKAMTNLALLRLLCMPVIALGNGLKLEEASGVLGSLAPLHGKLHSLDIRGAHISEACMASLGMAFSLSTAEGTGNLQALGLHHCKLEPQAWQTCAKVLPQLSELSLTIGKGITLPEASVFVGHYIAVSLGRLISRQDQLQQQLGQQSLQQQQQQQQQQQKQQQQQQPSEQQIQPVQRQQGGDQQQQAQHIPRQQQQRWQLHRQRQGPPTCDLGSEASVSGAAAGSACDASAGGSPGPSAGASQRGGSFGSSRSWKKSLHKAAPASTATPGAAPAGPATTASAGLSMTVPAGPVTTAAQPLGVPLSAQPLLLKVHGLKPGQVDDLRSLVEQQAQSLWGPLVVFRPCQDV